MKHRNAQPRAWALTPLAAALLALPGLGAAQSANPEASPPAPPASAADPAQQVIVVTSRIGRSGFTAPTPVTQLGAADLEVRGATTIANLVFELPATRPAPVAPFTLQFTGGAYIDLRGMGHNRTLVLVDGQRFVPTTSSGIVDTNVVPSALIERVDIVTGGASAAWGSDAVAGVANFVFKKKLDGFSANLQYGQSEKGDNKETAVSLGWGRSFGGGRGEIMVAGEFTQLTDPVAQRDREWSNARWGLVSGAVDGVNYARIATPGLTLSGLTTGGVITAGNGGPLPANSPLTGIQFGAGGTVLPFTYGTNLGRTLMVGGSGDWLADNTLMTSPLDRQSVYVRTTYDFSQSLRGWLDLSYARSHSELDRNPFTSPGALETTALTIDRRNPYLPAPVAALMDANKLTSFSMGRINAELGPPHNDVTNEVARIAAGLSGAVGQARWKAYLTHGRTDYLGQLSNHLNVANWRAATDVITGADGQAVCNPATVARLGAAPGCVPANVFGPGAVSPDVRAYVTGTMWQGITMQQDAGGASIQADPFSTWAGKVSLVGGIEARHESIHGDVDATSKRSTSSYRQGGWQEGNNKPINGNYTVTEVFAETVVPLLANQRAAKSLDLNAALRGTDYSTSGRVNTWKLGLSYTPTDGVLLRGTRSRDIRAASFNEMFLQGQNNSASVIDHGSMVNGTAPTVPVVQAQTGNPNLRPEIAKSDTLGVTLQNVGVQGLRASLDLYRIDLGDAISQVTPQAVLNGCYGVGATKNTQLCDFISRDANGTLSLIRVPYVNLQRIKTSGADLELAYRFKLAGGDMMLRLLGSHVREFIISDGVAAIARAGEMSVGTTQGAAKGGPKNRATLSGTYRRGPWVGFAQVRHVGGGVIDANPTTQRTLYDNKVPSKTYVDASVAYTLWEGGDRGSLTLFGKVNNLFDVTPPIIAESLNAPRSTNFVFWDLVGRAWAAGLRFTY